jgi:hypothetical protein
MTSRNVVLTTYAYTQSPDGIEQVTSPIYGHNLVHVPTDGLCWFYTILLGFFNLNTTFKRFFAEFISDLNVPLFKSLLFKDDIFTLWNDNQEFWNECLIIIEFLKTDILRCDEIIDSVLIERFGGPNVNWRSVFGPEKHEGFFHSFRVVEIYFSLILEIHFKVQICSANLSGISDKYTVSYNNSSMNSFCVYLNNRHYWFVKSPLDFISVVLEHEQCFQESGHSMSNLLEHNQHLEDLKVELNGLMNWFGSSRT